MPSFGKPFQEWMEKQNIPDTRCLSGVGPGWFPILETMIAKLKVLGWTGRFEQIKEKMGTLRVYATDEGSFTSPIAMAISEAEDASTTVCEECGAPGRLRKTTYGWYHTSCDGCATSREVANKLDEPKLQVTGDVAKVTQTRKNSI